jgi:hypothetical protein
VLSALPICHVLSLLHSRIAGADDYAARACADHFGGTTSKRQSKRGKCNDFHEVPVGEWLQADYDRSVLLSYFNLSNR